MPIQKKFTAKRVFWANRNWKARHNSLRINFWTKKNSFQLNICMWLMAHPLNKDILWICYLYKSKCLHVWMYKHLILDSEKR